MKVAFIGGFAFTPKGTMRARAHPLAAELVRTGHRVSIFLPPYDNLTDCGREWELEGVRIRNVGASASGSRGSGSRMLHYAQMLAQLISDVKRYRPDVIHVFKPKGFAGAAGTYFLLRGKTPVVLDCDDWEGRGGWNDIKHYAWIVKQYIDRQERWMMRSAVALTVASCALEDRADTIRGGRDSVYYVPNCGGSATDRELQDKIRAESREQIRRELGFDDKPVVLYSGHFEDQDSVAFFCHAAAGVTRNRRATVVFAGEGQQKDKIRELFSDVRNVKLRFFSRVPYEEFLRIVWACDVAAFPYPDDAVHRAKCSARIVDYMAMGRPVLTSAVGQNREYIVDGESGLLAAPSDEHDFADKLDQLLRDSELRRRLGENAKRRVHEKFSWSGAALRSCLAAYERVRPGFRHPLRGANAEAAPRTHSSAA